MREDRKKVIVIGGGAAGMMAAAAAGKAGAGVTLLEKNEKLGKKLFITGKGRGNVTNACSFTEFFEHIPENSRFLYSAFSAFDNFTVMDFFTEAGCPLKTERGNRVFPVSDHAYDLTDALKRELQKYHVNVKLKTEVRQLLTEEGRAAGVIFANGGVLRGDAVIVATGGLSYPSTGSTGDGYRFARAAGHEVTKLVPSLCSLLMEEDWYPEVAGLTLKNVSLGFYRKDGTELHHAFGELLFTHKGISGPLVLTATSEASTALIGSDAVLDLKPTLDAAQLDKRLLRELTAGKGKQLKTILGSFLPASFIPVLLKVSGLSGELRGGEVTREERELLGKTLKAFPMRVRELGGFAEAVITRGGVNVKEIRPKTMESKKLPGLYFAGEVLDLDAHTGGFNLQIAWSTGQAAGTAAAKRQKTEDRSGRGIGHGASGKGNFL